MTRDLLPRPASIDQAFRFPTISPESPRAFRERIEAEERYFMQQAEQRAQMLAYLHRNEATPARTVLNDPLQSGRVTGAQTTSNNQEPRTGAFSNNGEFSSMFAMAITNLLSYRQTPDGWKGIGKP